VFLTKTSANDDILSVGLRCISRDNAALEINLLHAN